MLVVTILNAVLSLCESWCKYDCSELNGDFHTECDDCFDENFKCKPGEKIKNEIQVPQQVFENISLCSELKNFEFGVDYPFVIRNMLLKNATIWNNWSGSKQEFLNKFGHVKFFDDNFLKREVAFHPELVRFIKDSGSVTLQNLFHKHDTLKEKNLFSYNPELTMQLIPDVKTMFSNFMPVETSKGVSMGNQYEYAEFHKHSSAIFVQTKGKKRWLLSSNAFDSFENPCITSEKTIRESEAVICYLNEGDSIFVPEGWWHGTCNLEEWNLGFTWFF